MTFGECQAGIEVTRTQNPAKAAAIEAWLDPVAHTYAVLGMDTAASRTWARI